MAKFESTSKLLLTNQDACDVLEFKNVIIASGLLPSLPFAPKSRKIPGFNFSLKVEEIPASFYNWWWNHRVGNGVCVC